MASYMRNQFPLVGIQTTPRRKLARAALSDLPRPAEPDLVEASTALYKLAPREYQYAAVELVAANVAVCSPGFVEHLEWMVTTKSWWDTVDGLASAVAGPLVLRHPALVETMDRWIEHENVWLARTAILHQLRYKSRTDPERLFHYCELRASDREFFIRKAIGWALREYSKTAPEAVLAFISQHERTLSGLSRREGLLWITGRKKRLPTA
jgi:3-methyladenine DNA glycosylase AlkD